MEEVAPQASPQPHRTVPETTKLPPQHVKEIQSSGPSGHKAHPSTKAKVPDGPRVGAEGREAWNMGQKHPPHTAVTVSLRN